MRIYSQTTAANIGLSVELAASHGIFSVLSA